MIDDAVYWGDIPFQVMRCQMQRDWSSTSGADANIIKLMRYIGGAKNDYWRRVRIYRCRRLINAVYTMYGHTTSGGPELRNDLVLKRVKRVMVQLDRERDKVLSRRGWTQGTAFKPWNWQKTQEKATALFHENRGMFDTLRRNVEGKAYTSPNYEESRMRSAPNLAKLVRILRDVEFDNA